MTRDNALQHAIAWGINQIFNINKEALSVVQDESMTEEQKLERLKGSGGTDLRLLNQIVLLRPILEFAKEEYPEQTSFFEWFEDKCKIIDENKMIQGTCGCKGCKE